MKLAKPKKGFMMEILGIIAGAVSVRFVDQAVNKFAPDLDPKIKALIPVAAGGFLAMQKSSLVKSAGLGMVGAGAVNLAKELVPSLGAADIPDVFLEGPADMSILSGEDDDVLLLNGPADQSILSGPADQSILSGAPVILGSEESMYYRLSESEDN